LLTLNRNITGRDPEAPKSTDYNEYFDLFIFQ